MFDGSHDLVTQILSSFAITFFIGTGLTGIALGIGLNISSSRTLRFLKAMNRWISVRNNLAPMDTPHDVDKAIYRHRRFFGVVFALSGAYAVFMLLFAVEFPYVVSALSRNATPVIVELLVNSLKWFLVLGGALAFIVGVMMIISTAALPALEVCVNRWHSSWKLEKGLDKMHLALDDWAEAFPRTAGLLLAFASAFALTAAMMVWMGN